MAELTVAGRRFASTLGRPVSWRRRVSRPQVAGRDRRLIQGRRRPTSPKTGVQHWVDAFNSADIDALAALHHDTAVNHQVAYEPIEGRAAIRRLFETEFGRATMVRQVENLFEDGDWAMLEWSDPIGLRGCGFFRIEDGKIACQRGYFDRLSCYKAQGIPLDEDVA